ncbi:VWA domain-containing protein [Pseudomonas aeruginosa]|nr:VWA domain-containing protein [Pseudomonas aeruginosa]
MAKSLLGSLPIYAQHLAEQTGVNVIVQGQAAYTDGKNVVVPFTEDDLELSFGYIAHECSHVRNTSMEVFQEVLPTPFRKNLLNILEDIRIERLSMEQYPGTENDIRYMNRKVLLEAFKPEQLHAQLPPMHIINNAVLFGTYWKLQEPQLEVPAKAYLEALDTLLGEELAEKVMDEALKTLQCNSTDEVLQLVDAIIALLPSEKDQPQQPENEPDKGEDKGDKGDQSGNQGAAGGDQNDSSGSPDPNQGDEGAGGESEANGEPDSKQKPSGKSPGQGQEENSAEGPASSDDESKPLKPTAPSNLREQVLTATEEDLEGLISEVGDAAAELLGQKARKEYHPAPPFILGGRTRSRSDSASQRRIQLGLENSSGLRQVLTGLLQAKVDCRVQLKRQGKRIDTGRIALMKGGETRVFRSKAKAERQSAAIQFLFDKSGSMDLAMEQAEAAIYAVLQSLEGIPLVTTGAMAFPGDSNGSGCCDLIKHSKERLSAAVAAGGWGAKEIGSTPMARAIWPAAVEVLRAKGERKILFVITDGQPDGGATASREMFERCEASGIEVIGLGFGDANSYVLSTLFKKYVDVGSVSKLKAALFGVVREALVA